MKVSGVLVLNDGRFAMIYRMNSDAESLSGRGHAGFYQIDEDHLIFHVKYWVENVEGATRIVPETIVKPKMHLDNDELTLNFESGSVQELERLTTPDEPIDAGVWELHSVRSDNSSKEASGMMVIAGDHYALTYVDKSGQSGGAFGGTGGRNGSDRHLIKLWNLELLSDRGVASTDDDVRKLELSQSESFLVLRGADGALFNFSQEANGSSR